MQIMKPQFKVTFHVPEGFSTMEQFIESVARVCYKSEDRITEDSAPKFIKNVLLSRGHGAMIEHCVASVRFISDRGFTHELVRHRLASFAQESTRYCNYSKGKFGSEITVLEIPVDASEELLQHYRESMAVYESNYLKALELGAKPEIARMWLPEGLRAEIVMTANLREWKTVFGLRAATAAHPMMRGLMIDVEKVFAEKVPCIFSKEEKQEHHG